MSEIPNQEEWRLVFDGFYRVSSYGRVFRVAQPNHKGRVFPARELKPTLRDGYPAVSISLRGSSRSWKVCQIVMLAFCGPCPEGLQCAHLNGVRTDSHLDNLDYVTNQVNQKHRLNHPSDPRGEGNPFSRLTNERVKAIRADADSGLSLLKVARKHGVAKSTVFDLKTRRTWKHV